MPIDRDSIPKPIRLDDYLKYIEDRSTLKNGVSMRDLTPIALGLDPVQLNSIMMVVRTFNLVDRTSVRDPHIKSKIVTFSRDGVFALATVIALGFDSIAHGRGKKAITNATEHFPIVQEGIEYVRTSLGFYPDILRWYPNLRGAINDPRMPEDPSKRIALSAKPFNPAPIIATMLNKRTGGSVLELERKSQYHLRPTLASG